MIYWMVTEHGTLRSIMIRMVYQVYEKDFIKLLYGRANYIVKLFDRNNHIIMIKWTVSTNNNYYIILYPYFVIDMRSTRIMNQNNMSRCKCNFEHKYEWLVYGNLYVSIVSIARNCSWRTIMYSTKDKGTKTFRVVRTAKNPGIRRAEFIKVNRKTLQKRYGNGHRPLVSSASSWWYTLTGLRGPPRHPKQSLYFCSPYPLIMARFKEIWISGSVHTKA